MQMWQQNKKWVLGFTFCERVTEISAHWSEHSYMYVEDDANSSLTGFTKSEFGNLRHKTDMRYEYHVTKENITVCFYWFKWLIFYWGLTYSMSWKNVVKLKELKSPGHNCVASTYKMYLCHSFKHSGQHSIFNFSQYYAWWQLLLILLK